MNRHSNVAMTHQSIEEAVLAFWFERDIVPGICEFRPIWFENNPTFDAEVMERFSSVYEQAAAGRLTRISHQDLAVFRFSFYNQCIGADLDRL